MGSGSGAAETASRWSKITLLHTGQMVGAVVIIFGVLKGAGEPAVKAYIIEVSESRIGGVERSIKLYRAEQQEYRTKATQRVGEVINRQEVIITKQKLRAEQAARAQAETQRLLRILIQQRTRPIN